MRVAFSPDDHLALATCQRDFALVPGLEAANGNGGSGSCTPAIRGYEPPMGTGPPASMSEAIHFMPIAAAVWQLSGFVSIAGPGFEPERPAV